MFTISESRMPSDDGSSPGRVGYFVNYTIVMAGNPANDPRIAAALKNFGVFVCSGTDGTATYLQDGKAYVRTLKALGKSGSYLIYEEIGGGTPGITRQWGFEIDPGVGGWQIVCRDPGNTWALFQVATKVSI